MLCVVSLKLQSSILLHRFLQTSPVCKGTVPWFSYPRHMQRQEGTKLDQTRSMFHVTMFSWNSKPVQFKLCCFYPLVYRKLSKVTRIISIWINEGTGIRNGKSLSLMSFNLTSLARFTRNDLHVSLFSKHLLANLFIINRLLTSFYAINHALIGFLKTSNQRINWIGSITLFFKRLHFIQALSRVKEHKFAQFCSTYRLYSLSQKKTLHRRQ